jgi:hypothetical protein
MPQEGYDTLLRQIELTVPDRDRASRKREGVGEGVLSPSRRAISSVSLAIVSAAANRP